MREVTTWTRRATTMKTKQGNHQDKKGNQVCWKGKSEQKGNHMGLVSAEGPELSNSSPKSITLLLIWPIFIIIITIKHTQKNDSLQDTVTFLHY